jgi:hypothetical protein
MKKYPISILFIFLPMLLFGQDLKPEIQELVNEIIQVNELHHKHVGRAAITTNQYKTFIKLGDQANISELISLLNHRNSVVKGYASWALADRKYLALDKILVQFLDSKEKVKSFNGCLLSKDELSIEFYFRVLYQSHENQISKNDSLFFADQVKKLDSLLLYYSGETWLVDIALEHNNANPKTYNRVRELALQKENSQAIIELAKYRKVDDIESIKKLGEKSFAAISYFPNKGFWPFLEKYLPTHDTLEFYHAMASFKDSSATLDLKNIYNRLDRQQKIEQIINLDEALTKYYCNNYQDIIFDIWEKHKVIDYAIADRLIKDNPEKAVTSFVKGLLNNNGLNYYFTAVDSNYEMKDSTLSKMLNLIAVYKPESLSEICKVNVKKTDFFELSAFLKMIKSKNMQSLTDLLIEKLRIEKSPYDIFQLTETLFYFKNTQINLQVIEILKSNKTKWDDDGNWANGFQKLFKEYGIKL